MRILAAVAFAAVALSGCNKGAVNETNASVEDVAKAVADSKVQATLQPGRWEASAKLVGLDAPDMPPQAKEMLTKQMMASASTVSICLKPEDINKPGAQFFGQANPNCRFDHYKMGGGTIDAKMSCSPPSGGTSVTTMTGRYDATHYEMALASTSSHQGPSPMTMRMQLTSQRVGECDGTEMQGAPAKS